MRKDSIETVSDAIKKYHVRVGDLARGSEQYVKVLADAISNVYVRKDRRDLEIVFLSGPNSQELKSMDFDYRKTVRRLVTSSVFSTLRLKMRSVEKAGYVMRALIGVRSKGQSSLKWILLGASTFRKAEILRAIKVLQATDKQFLLLGCL